jgi:hypothetical protein
MAYSLAILCLEPINTRINYLGIDLAGFASLWIAPEVQIGIPGRVCARSRLFFHRVRENN